MNNEALKEYSKKLRLYEKLLAIWVELYGSDVTALGNDDGGSNPPTPPPPPRPPGS